MRFGKFRILIKENGDWDRCELSWKHPPPPKNENTKKNNKNPELKQVVDIFSLLKILFFDQV